MEKALKEIKEIINKEKEFIITSHVRPDGDSIATQIALCLALQQIGKDVKIINKDEVPYLYRFLPGSNLIIRADKMPEKPRIVFYIECSDKERPELEIEGNHFIINIDHHITNTMYGDLNWIDPKAPAVGAMIYDFIKALNINLTKEIAENIFAAIAADTGGFRYNLYERTFNLCQEMIKAGVNAENIMRYLFCNYPATRMKLLAEVLSSLGFEANGKIVWIVLTNEMINKAGASVLDSEGFIDYVLFIQGVEMALFFKQGEDNNVRVSIRSSGKIDVSPIARKFGGGGHRFASACTLYGKMDSVIKNFVESVKNFYKQQLL